ncbi:uncharacterized protein LOC142817663 isoform X1 [Rhipicephalus microplus]|uniref:uncharacterized protein LOC142817663 isoform X1 n=1 Tax=Rhipicephalus microplus TaxID=6941 RepID=UPI003F6AD012
MGASSVTPVIYDSCSDVRDHGAQPPLAFSPPRRVGRTPSLFRISTAPRTLAICFLGENKTRKEGCHDGVFYSSPPRGRIKSPADVHPGLLAIHISRGKKPFLQNFCNTETSSRPIITSRPQCTTGRAGTVCSVT